MKLRTNVKARFDDLIHSYGLRALCIAAVLVCSGGVVKAVYKGVSVGSFNEWMPPVVAVYHPDERFLSSEFPDLRPCSGIQLSPYWILTARHCVTDMDGHLWPFGSIAVSNELSPGLTRPVGAQSAQAIILQPNGADAALVKIEGYSYSPDRLPSFYPTPTMTLIGSTLTCYGYGNYDGFGKTDTTALASSGAA